MRVLRSGSLLAILLLTGLLTGLTALWPPRLAWGIERAHLRSPAIAIGLGGYFLQPGELNGASGRAQPIIARPMLTGRAQWRAGRLLGSERWLLSPHVGILFPQISTESTAVLAWFLNGDLAYALTPRWLLGGGIGAHATLTVSSGRAVDIGGRFVTPSAAAATLLFTTNLAVGHWLDDRLRLDAGTVVSRLFDRLGRRFRFFLGVSYAL